MGPRHISDNINNEPMSMERKSSIGLMARVIVTIITLAGFLTGSLIYIAFFAPNYNLLQQLVVFLVAFILAITVVAITWITWAGRRGMMRGMWLL